MHCTCADDEVAEVPPVLCAMQMQQVSLQSSVRAASVLAPASPAAAAPSAAAPTADGQQSEEQQQQPPPPQQGPETLEQLQNGQPLTAEQQRQMQLSAAKQQFAAEQRHQLVQRARQVVAEAEAATQNGQADADPPPSPTQDELREQPEAGRAADAAADVAAADEPSGAVATKLDAVVKLDARPEAEPEEAAASAATGVVQA